MPILGIDGNKCVQCEECVHDCPKFLFSRGNSGLVEFADPYNSCLQCGHCVAVCPTDAILRRNMEDVESFPGIETPEHLVNYVNFFHLLQAKRSIRRYKKDIVPQTVLDQIFAAIRYAPAGSNSRTITYTLISDPSKIHTLSEMASELFVLKGIFGPVYGQHVQQKINRGLDPIFCGAPHVLIADSQDEMGFDIVNATVALTYGMLAAETLGVGTCWSGLFQRAARVSKEVRKVAGVQGNILGTIMLGYPAVKYYRAPSRPPLKMHEEE